MIRKRDGISEYLIFKDEKTKWLFHIIKYTYFCRQLKMDFLMDLRQAYTKEPDEVIDTKNRQINVFNIDGKNIDKKVVDEFGEEWLKFNDFTDKNIKAAAEEYFDIVTDDIVNKQTYALDIGCGTGRWSRYLSTKAGFIEAVDPSNAIFAADKLLGNIENIRLTKASVETLPFNDETFDFAMSIGVLHHIPDTQQAMIDCVKKVKKGGYFYVYLYYNLEKRGRIFTSLFKLSDLLRSFVSKLPGNLKKFICDVIAITVYMPIILLIRFFYLIGWNQLAKGMPLSAYYNKSFFIIRNDALDRFGTRLEQRFSASQVVNMMETAGLTNVIVSSGVPYYHAIGKKL
jgi:ubiquinone/menaquinone biosynthesis C-methylase UbiE